MPGLSALKQLTESDDPRLREIGFKLLQRGGSKFFEFLDNKPLGRALDSLVKKGTMSREGKRFTGIPDVKHVPRKEFSAMRLGGPGGGTYDQGITHYRSGRRPSGMNLPKRDYGRLRLYSETADPSEHGFYAHTHPMGTPASPEHTVAGRTSGDAPFMSSFPNVDFPIVQTPRPIEEIYDLGGGKYGVNDPFKGPSSTREFKSPEAAEEYTRSFGGGREMPEDWRGTLDQYRFGEIEAGKSYDSPGPSAFRRAAAAIFPESQAGLRSLAEEVMVELKKRFPDATEETLGGEIRRALQARQAENYPENIDYTYHATDPERFQEVQRQLKTIGGGALDKLKLPE
jgi:hypothetical protein